MFVKCSVLNVFWQPTLKTTIGLPYILTEKLEEMGINTQRFDRLLELIHAPVERTGLSHAIPNLLGATKAVSRLAPSSQSLTELVSALEAVNQNLLPRHLASRDMNPMLGYYEDYPVYSLFTQLGKTDEPSAFTARFHLVTGLLLALIWLSNTPWHPIPRGYDEFVNKLRQARRNKKWAELSAVNADAASFEELITLLAHPQNGIASKALNLAIEIQELLSNPDTQQPKTASKSISAPSGVKHIQRPRQRNSDLGDQDEWKVGKEIRTRPVVSGRPTFLEPNVIVLRKSPAHQPGLDSSELEVAASIVEAPVTTNTGELPSIALQKLQVLDARFATEFDNQFLPYSWEVLNEHDVASLVGAITAAINNSSETRQTRIGALAAGLSIATSRSPEELAGFKFIRTAATKPLSAPAILLEKACWFPPFPMLDRFEPTTEQSNWLRPVGDGCYLPLPAELLSALSELSAEGETLGETLGCSSDKFESLVNDFCRIVRKDAKSRANVSWLRSIIFHRMLALSQDDVGSIATLGNTEHAPTVGLYYATFKQDKWREIYSRALSSLSLTPSIVGLIESLPYGSRQYPEEVKRRELIAAFAQSALTQCKQAKSIEDLIASHNLFASYTFLMLLATTGHRPAEKISFSTMALDLANGWAIISDKITSPSTRVRLIPLPDLVIQQLRNYESHLRNLSARLHQDDPELAAMISMLVETPRHALVSLFFWLDEDLTTSPIDIRSVKERYGWPYEGNAFRHFLATGLREEDVPAEYIAILLAHVENGQYGFGKFSALSPSTWKESICLALSRALESQGWVNVAGLTHLRKSPPDQQGKRRELAKLPEIDFFAKTRTHIETTKEDRRVVRAAFLATKKSTPPDCPRDEFLESFREEIIKQSEDAPDRLAKRLNFHVRFVRMHRHAFRPTSIPGWATDMHVEDTPLLPESLALAACADHYREAIPVISQGFNEMNHHERIALIMVSSVLFGGLLRKSLVEQIPERLASSIRWFEKQLWVDFDDPQSGGCQRWFPDPVTALLIARLITTSKSSLPVRGNHLKFSITQLLNKMSESPCLTIKTHSLDNLIKVANAYFTLHLPGLIRAFACGDVRSASLTEGAWLRLLSGRPLSVERSTEATPNRGSIRPHRSTSEDVKSAREIYTKICEAIRNELPASSSGATNRKGERKNHLNALSESLDGLSKKNENMPSVVFAIISWADHLAMEGSVVVRKPAIGTIYSYITDISAPLIEFSAEVDFIELNEAELTDIYQRVNDSGSKNTRSSRAKSLRWFHEFCEEEFDLPELDWDEIAPGLTNDKSKVSANLVTFTEYELAKNLLKNHALLRKRDRQMHEVALILLYRCGLRLGELLRLTVSDLVLSIRNVLLVRNGIYGKTKTRAGIRQIPWLDRLSNEELAILNDWIAHRKTVTKDDPWGALFGETEEARTLEVRLHLSRVLTGVLRTVTGDPVIRIHHLRHGAGTSALSIALATERQSKMAENGSRWFGCKTQDIASEFREFHLRQSMPTRRIVYAISQALGHTSPRTTCWHYGHSLDLALHDHVSQMLSLKNVEVAYLSGMNQNLLNVTVSRNKGKNPAALALEWLLKDVLGLEPLSKLADHPVTLNDIPSPAPIQYITSPKLVHIILTDISNGFQAAQIASRYARDEIEITALQAAAVRIERDKCYRAFSLVHTSGKNHGYGFINDRKHGMEKLISGHAIELIQKFKQVLENSKLAQKLDDAIDVWLEQYQANHSGLRMPYPDDLEKMVELLEELGIKKEQIALVGNSLEHLKEMAKLAKLKLPESNLILRSGSFRSNTHTSRGVINAPTLVISQSASELKDIAHQPSGGASLPMQKWHHLFFLSAVILNYRKNLARLGGTVD